MSTPWTAERVVTPAEAVALIEAQHPRLAPVHVKPLGAGWDNTACRVNGTWVFRFPRRHILVDDTGRACDIVDWGDVHRGHPGLDFALAFCVLPPRARDDFVAAYGEIDDESWHLGRQRALLYSATLAAYGTDIGDADLVREGLYGLRYVLS